MSNITDDLNNNLTNGLKMSDSIKQYVKIIKEYINQEEIIELKKNDIDGWNKNLAETFSEFIKIYPVLFEMIVSDNDISMLHLMLDSITYLNTSKDVKNDFMKIKNALGEKLNDIYVKDTLEKAQKK